jgi:hypothetical protein
MDGERSSLPFHPGGKVEADHPDRGLVGDGRAVETFAGMVFVRWDPDAAVTAFALLTYFWSFSRPMACSTIGSRIARRNTAAGTPHRSKRSWGPSF